MFGFACVFLSKIDLQFVVVVPLFGFGIGVILASHYELGNVSSSFETFVKHWY